MISHRDDPPLPDEAIIAILEFLQRFTECFENQYYGEIHRYYEERSRANRKAADPPSTTNDQPF
ncbi:hypothetical protein [Acidithiobacillus sulfuriphilus]|uniref:hypothetical protein n=1 Tax=Acidithiobacillus sulfuriphilus TaxID=1867749 RepID=UPI003F5ED802